MKKIVKKYGDQVVISFTKEEVLVENLKEGDVVEVLVTKEISKQ